jgi:hypothetical protein
MRAPLAAVLAAATAAVTLSAPAVADAAAPLHPTPAAAAPKASPAAPERVADPAHDLAPGWQHSTDRAVTSSSDAAGFHLLVADAADAYQWRTAASLAEPGFPTDQWIGQFCVTASGPGRSWSTRHASSPTTPS